MQATGGGEARSKGRKASELFYFAWLPRGGRAQSETTHSQTGRGGELAERAPRPHRPQFYFFIFGVFIVFCCCFIVRISFGCAASLAVAYILYTAAERWCFLFEPSCLFLANLSLISLAPFYSFLGHHQCEKNEVWMSLKISCQ